MLVLSTIALVVLFVLILFIKTVENLRKVIFVSFMLIGTLIAVCDIARKEMISLKGNTSVSTIPTLDRLTNGLYRVINSYEGPGEMNLVILHQERMTSIDPVRRVFTTTPINPIPVLVSLDRPITKPGDTNATYKEFVEVSTDSFGNKSLQRYFPFRHME